MGVHLRHEAFTDAFSEFYQGFAATRVIDPGPDQLATFGWYRFEQSSDIGRVELVEFLHDIFNP